MISALLVSLIIGGPAPALPAGVSQDDPPIRLWINNDRRFLPGDRAKVEVRTREDGYLLVFHVDPDGRLRVLFPLDPDRDNFVRGGKKYEIRGRGDRESFEVDNTTGKGTIYAAVSRDPIRFDGFVLGDHWDYRALTPSRLPNDPEPDLNELVRRMAQSDFDYDLINYYVNERVAYRDYTPSYYGSFYDDPWCYSYYCRPYHSSSFSIGIFFGRPYRWYYYDPYYYVYDPFYNPFFYPPRYYVPVHRSRYGSPYYGYPHYGYPYNYRDRYFYDRTRPYRQPYTPYRFRGADGVVAGYRDRYGPTRWVNTLYNPPRTPVREQSPATPARRPSQPVAENPSESRRGDLEGPRLHRRIPEARRVGDAGRLGTGDNQGAGGAGEKARWTIEEPRRDPNAERSPVDRAADQPERVRPDRGGDERRVIERPPAREARPVREPERAPAREARPEPARETRPQPVRESRPEPRGVDRPSSPPRQEGGGGGRPAGEGPRRR
jgi:hypothetical protein